MASITSQADLQKGFTPVPAESFATSKGEVSNKGMHIPDLDMVDAKNVMPTVGGYTSFFGTGINISTDVGPEFIQKPISYRTYSGHTAILGFARDGLYVKVLASNGEGIVSDDTTTITLTLDSAYGCNWIKVFSTTPIGVWENWTWAIIRNKLYLYQKGMNVFLRVDGDEFGNIKFVRLNPTYIVGTGKLSTLVLHVNDVNQSTGLNYKQAELFVDGSSIGKYRVEVGNNPRKAKEAPKLWEELLSSSGLFNVTTLVTAVTQQGFSASANLGGKAILSDTLTNTYAVSWFGANTNISVSVNYTGTSNVPGYGPYEVYGVGAYRDGTNYHNIYDVELEFDYATLLAAGTTTIAIDVDGTVQTQNITVAPTDTYEEVYNTIVGALELFTSVSMQVMIPAAAQTYKFVLKPVGIEPTYTHVLTAASTLADMPFISVSGVTATPYLTEESFTKNSLSNFSYDRLIYLAPPDNTHPNYNDVLPTGTVLSFSTTAPNYSAQITTTLGETKGQAIFRLQQAYWNQNWDSYFINGSPFYNDDAEGPLLILTSASNTTTITPIDDFPVGILRHGTNHSALLSTNELNVRSRTVDANSEDYIQTGFSSPLYITGTAELDESYVTIKKDGNSFIEVAVDPDILLGEAFGLKLQAMAVDGLHTSDEGQVDIDYDITINYTHIADSEVLSATLTKDTTLLFTQDAVTTTSLALPQVEGIFSARNRLGAWTKDNRIHTSSASDPADFVPSKVTQANETSVNSIRGNIVHCLGYEDGFVIYATGNILIASYTGEQFVYNYKAVEDSSGVIDPRHITGDLSKHFYWSNTGLIAVNPKQQKIDQLAPELTDWINRHRFPIKLSLLSNRFLSISLQYEKDTFSYRRQRELTSPTDIDYGTREQVATTATVATLPILLFGKNLYTTYSRALVFDIILGRWGTCDVLHKVLYSLNPINQQGFPIEKDYALSDSVLANYLRGLAIVDATGNHLLCNDQPTDSYCVFGKYSTHKYKKTKLVEVFAEFVNLPTTTHVEVERTVATEQIEDTTVESDITTPQYRVPINLGGQWFNILVRGTRYHLKRLMARGYNYGR